MALRAVEARGTGSLHKSKSAPRLDSDKIMGSTLIMPSQFLQSHCCCLFMFRNRLYSKSHHQHSHPTRWTWADLTAYNIKFCSPPMKAFFGIDVLPPVPMTSGFATTEVSFRMHHQEDIALTFAMKQATYAYGNVKPAVELFATKLLDAIGYTSTRRLLILHQDLQLEICDKMRHAKPDISLVQADIRHNILKTLLIVHEDKKRTSSDSSPQMMAEAVATFQYNNDLRYMRGLPSCHHQVSYLGIMYITNMLTITQDIPAIILVGSHPIFYIVPVTSELVDAIRRGKHPKNETVVRRFEPLLYPRSYPWF
jgi:hypothetical protein